MGRVDGRGSFPSHCKFHTCMLMVGWASISDEYGLPWNPQPALCCPVWGPLPHGAALFSGDLFFLGEIMGSSVYSWCSEISRRHVKCTCLLVHCSECSPGSLNLDTSHRSAWGCSWYPSRNNPSSLSLFFLFYLCAVPLLCSSCGISIFSFRPTIGFSL